MSGDALFQVFERGPGGSTPQRLTLVALGWIIPPGSEYFQGDPISKLSRYTGLRRSRQYEVLRSLVRENWVEDETLTLGRRLRLNVGDWHISGISDSPVGRPDRCPQSGVPEFPESVSGIPDSVRDSVRDPGRSVRDPGFSPYIHRDLETSGIPEQLVLDLDDLRAAGLSYAQIAQRIANEVPR